MLVRVKLVGNGTENSPYTVPLPTWILVHIDYTKLEAVVDIPQDDCTADMILAPESNKNNTPGGKALIKLTAKQKGDWVSHLDAKYPQHKGEYDPVVA